MSLKTPNSDYHFWLDHQNKIHSSRGGWQVRQGVYASGYDMMNDLVGNTSYMQVYMLNILGRLPERRLADWVEAIHICLSWPDPRIWCNQIGALGGSAQTDATAASTAGTLAADSTMYGSRPLLAGVTFIQSAMQRYQQGVSIEEIIKQEVKAHRGQVHIMGYARPLVNGDERIPAMERVTKSLNFEIGEHLLLAYAIDEHLHKHYGERININGYMSAFLSDQGFTPEEVYRIFSLLVMSGVTACFVEEKDKTPGSFLPLQCDDIDYQGKPARPVPEQ